MSGRAIAVLVAMGLLLAGLAAWLLVETRARPEAGDVPAAARPSAVPQPAAPPPQPVPATPAARPAQPSEAPVVAARPKYPPVEVYIDEERLAQLPEKLPDESLRKAKLELNDAIVEVRKLMDADRPVNEVMEEVDRRRQRLGEFMASPTNPSVAVQVIEEAYNRLEQQVRTRGRQE